MDFEKDLSVLIEKSLPEIKKKGGKFSISSLIPSEWNIEEEKEWDRDLDYECIKGRVNKKIIEMIRNETKLTYDAGNSDFRIIYDLRNNKFEIKNENKYIFGRYEKYSREIAQTRWVCRNCKGKGCKECNGEGKNYVSIEEIIGEFFKKEFKCKNYFLHASGREDVDVENHAGRPFVFELIEPEYSEGDLEKARTEIEEDGRVKIRDLKIVNRGFIEMVSNSHFHKSYLCEIEFESKTGKLDKKDLDKIKKLEGKIIHQRTPMRVKHRRADKIRKRKILKIDIIEFPGKETEKNKNKLIIEITTEPGTYIKELISGDEGRTKPNLSEILGIKAECRKLTVSKIFDGFLNNIA